MREKFEGDIFGKQAITCLIGEAFFNKLVFCMLIMVIIYLHALKCSLIIYR